MNAALGNLEDSNRHCFAISKSIGKAGDYEGWGNQGGSPSFHPLYLGTKPRKRTFCNPTEWMGLGSGDQHLRMSQEERQISQWEKVIKEMLYQKIRPGSSGDSRSNPIAGSRDGRPGWCWGWEDSKARNVCSFFNKGSKNMEKRHEENEMGRRMEGLRL